MSFKMSELVIKKARIVLPGKVFEGDIGIDSGRISKIGRGLSGDETYDAEGKYVIPGLIDAHVHFREPGASEKEDWITGSSAAAAGGVTTVLEMPNTKPPTVTKELLEEKRTAYASRSIVNYGFHFGAAAGNEGELRKIDRIASVKFYLGSTTGGLLVESDSTLFEQLKILAERDILATAHAESEPLISLATNKLRAAGRNDLESYSESRPNAAAAEAANRMIGFSKKAGSRLHICHVSTREEVGILAMRRKELPLTAEASPHHLFLTKEDYKELGTLAKVNPPLRSKEDQKALWKALSDGTIDMIATDHAPHLLKEKKLGIWDAPSGVPGLETMLPLLLNEVNAGRLTIGQVSKLTSENPAKIFRIGNKGGIKEGYDADLVVVDMNMEKEVDGKKLYTKCKWSPFAGRSLKGWPVMTFVSGRLVFDRGKIKKNKGEEVSYV